jgi:site-specific recombinase XerD
MNGVGLGLSGCSVQEIFTQAEQGARFHLEGTVNTLLHSFATHLLEKGGDLRYIQDLLGRVRSKPLKIYTHITKKA